MTLKTATLADEFLIVYSENQFDLDLAAAFGKKDWDTVLRTVGGISGQDRDKVYGKGAHFLAPLEFLSEVFIDGTPLSKPYFEEHCEGHDAGRSLQIHYPRFGPALLLELADKRRFVCSILNQPEATFKLVNQ